MSLPSPVFDSRLSTPDSRLQTEKVTSPSKRSAATTGVILAAAACTFFAAAGTVTRLGINAGADTSAVMVIQVLVTFLIAAGTARGRLLVTRTALPGLALLGVVAGSGAIFLLEGYARLGVAPVAVIFALYPGVVGVYLWVFSGKRPSTTWFVTLGLAFVGVALAIGGQPGTSRPMWEYLFPVLATLTVAGNDLIAQKVVREATPAQAVAWVNLVTCGLALAIYNRAAVAHFIERPSLLTGAALGVVLYLALQLKFMGIDRAGPRLVSLVAAGQPAVAVVIAAIVLKEALSPLQMIGIGLVVVALIAITRDAEKLGKSIVPQ